MAPQSKIVDEAEVKRWFEEGRTYGWMVLQYRQKYHLEIAPTTFSNLRAKRGLPRRIPRDSDLIPWEVKPEHRQAYPLTVLRAESRLRTGLPMKASSLERLAAWKERIGHEGLVIHYDPETEQGWWLVKRRPGIDNDMIREPRTKTTKRLPRD